VSSRPRLLQGIYAFEGQGLDTPFRLAPALTYTVPVVNEAQFVYFRGGNSSAGSSSDGLSSPCPSNS